MEPTAVERKLTAILSADVKGYSRLMGDDEAATIRTLTTYHELMSSLIQQHRGRVIDTPGDNLLAEFGSVVNAVTCAVELQRELAQRNAELPDHRKMEFRIGINLGDVVVEGERIYGDGVNVAARLEGLAEPGGICISEAVRSAVGQKLPLDYEFMGEQQVKNIAEPVRAYHTRLKPGAVLPTPSVSPKIRRRRQRLIMVSAAVAVLVIAVGVITWLARWGPTIEPASKERMALPLPDKPSIAVLPFANISDDPKQEYFADGMTDDLITDLSKISGVFVIARNSSFAYKGKTPDVRQVSRELGVKYVLEGSVRRAGNQVRINAKLIDATTGGHVWADRYDGSLNDVFGLQDKVTRKIITVLAIQLTTGEETRVARKETDNAEAYDALLQGWQHYLRQTPDNFRSAISYFKRAVELDPQYARAYAALAATYWQSWKRFWHASVGLYQSHDARAEAEKFLEKAMQSPTPLAHQVAADVSLHMHRHEEAIAEAERAIALDPNDPDSYIALAGALSLAGRPDEALQGVERAMRLNPHYPPFYLYELGMAQFGMQQLEKAAVSLERATALNPDDRWSLRLLLATYGLLGRSENAARVFETIRDRVRRGYQNYMDPLTIRSSAFWHPFKERADADRFAKGLRRAGVPD